MPTFSVNKKQLQKAINLCNQISPKKSEVDIFTFTKIILGPQSLELSVANGLIYYRVEISLENSPAKTAQFLVKTETLANIISLMGDENLEFTLELAKNNLLVQGHRSKHNLRINSEVTDFHLPEKEEENRQVSLTVAASDLALANRFGLIAVGQPKNVYQPEFLSVCYSFIDDLFVVSTDRFRIIKHKLATSKLDFAVGAEPTNFLFLPKNLQILNSALEEGQVNITLETGLAFFESNGQTFICRYGDGKYPDYNKIIPQSFACNFVLNVKETLEALRQVYFFAKANVINKNISLQVNPAANEIKFSTTSDDGNSSESGVSIDNYQGQEEAWSQAFNADYLIEYISSLTCERFLWEANPGKPSVLSPEADKDNQLYLVSGLR